MSYCRWSDNDYQCDVYVYEDVSGGWTTHVAARRVKFEEPLPPQVSFRDDPDAWFARNKFVSDLVDSSERYEIGLTHDGESFTDGSASACADRLESLRASGYKVPQYAIDALREEDDNDQPVEETR